MTVVDVLGSGDELTDGTGCSVDAAMGTAIDPYRKSRNQMAHGKRSNRLVPVVARPEDIMVAVSGDPLRTKAYVFAHNGILGYPTTRTVHLPPGWSSQLREARRR